jgi:hypothetical protein
LRLNSVRALRASLGENSDEFQVVANSLQSVDQVEGYFVEAPRLQEESKHFVNFDRYRDGSDGVTAARSPVPNRHERQAPKTGPTSRGSGPVESVVTVERADGRRVSEAEHFFRCTACDGWIDLRDLAWVEDHEGPLPHPAQDGIQ